VKGEKETLKLMMVIMIDDFDVIHSILLATGHYYWYCRAFIIPDFNQSGIFNFPSFEIISG
jgi:hypothetical protein